VNRAIPLREDTLAPVSPRALSDSQSRIRALSNKPWRVLIVEDSETDAKLVIRTLRASGRQVEFERVEDADAMQAALDDGSWDLILSDWSMPHFSAIAALLLLREAGMDLPFIIVSGTIGEDLAVEAMRRGAHDCVAKERPGRLVPAVEREVRECRDRAEHRETERRRAAIVDSALDAIVGIDEAGGINEFNPAAEKRFGYARAEAIGRPMTELLFPPRLREHHQQRLERYLRTGKRAGGGEVSEVVVMARDGREFLAEVSVTRLGAMSPPNWILFIRDLSAREAADAARREVLARYTRLVDSGLVGVIVSESSGDITEANDTFLQMVGYSRDDLAEGLVSWANMTPPDWTTVTADAASQLRAHGVAPPCAKEYVRKDGTRVPVLVGVATLGSSANISLSIDLTEQKHAEAGRVKAEEALRRSEAHLRQAQKMEAIGRLAAGVAHDFNNVLSVIMSYGEALLDDLQPSNPMRADIEEIYGAASRGVRLTRQLLLFGRQQAADPKVVDLHEAVSGMENMLRRIVGSGVALTVVPPTSAARAKLDPSHLEQVILNLIVNARDALPSGGTVTLQTATVMLEAGDAVSHLRTKAGLHVMLAVSDTGVGMDGETQTRIFEPFFTTKEVGKGTGLGLSTVFGIVQQSGGGISVCSEPGKGTTFKVYFPSMDASSEVGLPVADPTTSLGV
jgi:two-component system cell cycle sensor histidine kinase/response regulator CckA